MHGSLCRDRAGTVHGVFFCCCMDRAGTVHRLSGAKRPTCQQKIFQNTASCRKRSYCCDTVRVKGQ